VDDPIDLTSPTLYINRELSWLAFDERVLEEAQHVDLPLFERLKFLGIFSTNLDEFFMVRVAGLKQQLAGGVTEVTPDGALPGQQLAAISVRVHDLVARQYAIWREEMAPSLAEQGIRVLDGTGLTKEQAAFCAAHFRTQVFPALTPLAVDPGHPVPQFKNESLNLGLLLAEQRGRRWARSQQQSFAVVQVPRVFPRLLELPQNGGRSFVQLESLIALNAGELFPGYKVLEAVPFRVTRNWDLSIDEEESEDLLSTIQAELLHRDRGAAVRLEVDAAASDTMTGLLLQALHLEEADVYRLDGPLQIDDLGELGKLDARPSLRQETITPVVAAPFRGSRSILEVIRERDVLLHHPYESFEPVSRFLNAAAEDPDVLAIKQTLYRTGDEQLIVRALNRAAQSGKQVAALVEIKARFDEEQNIAWGRQMEDSGVHVIYGLVGLKTHCKVALVVRRESGGIRRYVHLGTGNYNPTTARFYTDLSLFTADPEIADDASALFNLLTGYSSAPHWRRLAVAPFNLVETLLGLIEQEAEHARRGEPARIRAKMNSLVDPGIIRALYAASQAGVEIDLIVRGICCLRPGVPGVSERIRVRSIVDHFLEHSRVFAFGPDERAQVFMSSADWMPRNFYRRVETMVPILDPALRQRAIDDVLTLAIEDNLKAHALDADGRYSRVAQTGEPLRSQMRLVERARRAAETPLARRQA